MRVRIRGRADTRSKEEIEQEWLMQRRSDTSILKWADALGIDHELCQVEGVLVHVRDWDAFDDAVADASKRLSTQWETNKSVRGWYGLQLRKGKKVQTEDLAQKLGAGCVTEYADYLRAFAYDLFHADRGLYRALKTQEAHEAGLEGEALRAAVSRAVAEQVSEDDALQAYEQAEPVAIPLPIQQAPQIKPNAPSDTEPSALN